LYQLESEHTECLRIAKQYHKVVLCLYDERHKE